MVLEFWDFFWGGGGGVVVAIFDLVHNAEAIFHLP